MIKKMEWFCEPLDEFTWRAKVIGGWVIKTIDISNKGNVSTSIVFIPDSDHQWIIRPSLKEVKKEESISEGY